ncbi:uncharacterized protein J7T54_003863 [Emericellopsis cladophorae]|uniref:CFEM domain-containing protein n=1 Tax=Emericellopsis cladophorae TaxID=2686198 RepID=A0A9Q0BB54_9HYPO|nr:uncharacterized protein J7T54_003863 [Emericellopsis cladophorae]KAI6778927.1 hypothetical protein J7T54_003863 [Emericellopsis cladophorae]
MYKSTAILALVAGVVQAQSLPDIPSCAIQCLSTAAPDAGCSGITDFECLCGSIEEIMQSSSDCFTSECDSSELESAQSAASEFCANLVGTTPGSMTMPMTSTVAETTVTNPVTVTTPTTPMMSDMTETDIMVTTETDSDGNPTATRTEESDATGTDDEGNNDSGVGKPVAGLVAAGLAVLAAL